MIFLIRGLIYFLIAIAVTTCTFTVKVGERTTAQHIQRIWKAPETQELVHGVKEKAGPMFERIQRGVKAGVREAAGSDAGQAVGDAIGEHVDSAKREASDRAAGAVRDAAEAEARRRADEALGVKR